MSRGLILKMPARRIDNTMTAWYDVSMLPDEREKQTGGNRHEEARGTDNMAAHADVYAPVLVMQGIGKKTAASPSAALA